MIIYPAMDLIEGQCVRLLKCDFDKKTIYEPDPFLQAQKFKDQGATWLHIVDLDGAKQGSPKQTALIVDIANKAGLKVQTGGGLREFDDIIGLNAEGVDRVVIGSMAVKSPKLIDGLLRDIGNEAVTLALDIKLLDGEAFIATNGWQQTSSLSLDYAMEQFIEMGAKHFLITDISRDGLLTGPNTRLYEGLFAKYPSIEIQVSGGMSSLEDIANLKAIKAKGVIVGKALYENKFSLAEALKLVGGE